MRGPEDYERYDMNGAGRWGVFSREEMMQVAFGDVEVAGQKATGMITYEIEDQAAVTVRAPELKISSIRSGSTFMLAFDFTDPNLGAMGVTISTNVFAADKKKYTESDAMISVSAEKAKGGWGSAAGASLQINFFLIEMDKSYRGNLHAANLAYVGTGKQKPLSIKFSLFNVTITQ